MLNPGSGQTSWLQDRCTVSVPPCPLDIICSTSLNHPKAKHSISWPTSSRVSHHSLKKTIISPMCFGKGRLHQPITAEIATRKRSGCLAAIPLLSTTPGQAAPTTSRKRARRRRRRSWRWGGGWAVGFRFRQRGGSF